MRDLIRRTFLAITAARAVRCEAWDSKRLGVVCQLGPTESSVRIALSAAYEAGFRCAQIQIPWNKVDDAYLKALPNWVAGEGVRIEVVGAYVNCCAPENVLMDCRREDLPRAIELAGALGARRLTAWTGGYGKGLMTADPRNFTPQAEDAIRGFLDPFAKRLEQAGVQLALESYITLACPDAVSLARLLKRLPGSIGAVLDPPNLTPVARYAQRDQVLREMFRALRGRVVVVHLKDFRLAKKGDGYDLPGPLRGEMNYRLYVDGILKLVGDPPIVAEHLKPSEFAAARRELLPLFEAAR